MLLASNVMTRLRASFVGMKIKYLPLVVAALGALLPVVNPAFAQTWTQTSAPSNLWTAVASSADGRTLVVTAGDFGGDGQIYSSTNSGDTWIPTSAPATNWQAVTSSADGTKLAASGSGGVFTSTDSGATWELRTNINFQSLASSADGTMLVGSATFNVYTSTNSGITWGLSSGIGSCVASSADGTRLVTAYYAYPGFLLGGIFTSTNAGLDWKQTSAPLDLSTGWNALASSADGTRLAATIGATSWPTGPGPIYTSRNAGGTWFATGSPISHWSSIACSADGIKLVAAGVGGVHTSTASGATWTWITNIAATPRASVASSADGGNLVAAVNGGGIYTRQFTPEPVLNITSASNNLVLSWIVPSMDFVLQQNSDLTTTNWADLTNKPTLNLTNLQYQVSVSLTNGRSFYRLRH